ncbi:nucleotidyltransferase domain-containing protein [Candidatus Woesearchaeota archaeon]|nr:nucleotidyltransferase domain-containing protein [Candidatus Woesearchaeota archaeon]
MASKKLLELSQCQKKLEKLLDKNLVDIIIFGSLAKDGLAHDLDLALIFRGEPKAEDYKAKITALIQKPLDLQVINLESIYSPFWLTLIKEGFSVRKNRFLHQIYKIKPVVIYKYSLKKLNPVQKVQFERGLKKIIAENGGFLTRSVVLISLEKKNRMMEFLKSWNLYYESQEYELLPLLRKEEFL